MAANTPPPGSAPPPSGRDQSLVGGPLESPPERVLVDTLGGWSMLWLNAIAFVGILMVGAVAFWITPKQAVSESEKRDLVQMPALTFAAVFDGSYEKDFEEFYNDNFPLRERWIDLTATLKSWRGFRGEEAIEVFAAPPAEEEEEGQQKAGGTDFVPADEEFRRVKSVIVVGDRAVQQFGGSEATLTPFIDLIHTYRQALPLTRMYVMSIPSGSDMYLPRQVNDGRLLEKRNADLLYSRLPQGVTAVRALDYMLPHREEYLQFRTDHHWTGRGAYYAYRAFAEAAGFTPLNLDQMTYGRIQGGFLGTLYSRTRSPALQANPDFVEYWKVPGEPRMTIYGPSGTASQGRPGRVYQETASGGNSYGVFLGGDHPLVRIDTNNRSGRSIVMIKDSYGNAFAPYLAAHYDRIFVIDYRSFKGNIPQLIAENGITDLLYAHNSFAHNSRGTVTRGLAMLREGRR